ncbi:MAG: hypothetical protein PUD90_09270 [Clostridia bacterium]|nr:hypothetical protein [[Bacteroides] pectinophilus]MDD5873636.1 hypothetical protein [Clostridia bacterium]
MYNIYASDYDAACAAVAVMVVVMTVAVAGIAGGRSVIKRMSRYAALADFRRMKKKMSDIETQFGYIR